MMDLGTFMGRQYGNSDADPVPVEVESLAVQFKNANKCFETAREPVEVMNNFNMSIPQGSIYSLLGSSGCGKTTVLSCIVGLHKLDAGTVTVFGSVPGSSESQIPGPRVGYMPQELSLYAEFSISEIFYYFGTIFAMSSSEIKESTDFLVNFLDLPPASRRITTLSGGQKRRVSLAASLLHNPELLILDEPTVGVDPLLRQSIWKYLILLVSKRKTTVLITTHYIEEARNSHMVGLMRNGRLLVEQAPDSLMRQYNAILLEDIVLKLCEEDSENSVNSRRFTKEAIGNGNASCSNMKENSIVFQNYSRTPEYDSSTLGITSVSIKDYKNRRRQNPNIAKEYHGTYKQDFSAPSSVNSDCSGFNCKKSAYRLKALVLRNICQSFRNLPYLLFVLFLPAIQMIFLCLTIGNPPKSLNIGVINHDTSLCNYTSQSKECFSGDLSCIYLDMLPKDAIRQVAFKEEADAIEAVRKGETWGVITFPTNYSVFMIDRFLSGNDADNVSLDGSTIKLDMDLSNVQIGVSLKQVFFDTLQLYMAKILRDCEYDPKISEPPIEYRAPIYGDKDASFREFTAPSTLLGILFFFPICSSAIKIILDKKQGTLDRGKVAGVKTWEMMTSFFLTEGTVVLVQSGLSFVILVNVFSIEIKGSVLLALSLAILVGVSGLSMGFLFATFCNDILDAIVLAMGCFFPNFLLSGMIWPIQGMPYVLQCISYVLPCTLACESIRSIVSRGWGFTHLHVWPGFATTIAWISFYWILNVIVQRKMSRK